MNGLHQPKVAQQTDETSSFFVLAMGKVRDFLFADRISIRELRDYNLQSPNSDNRCHSDDTGIEVCDFLSLLMQIPVA